MNHSIHYSEEQIRAAKEVGVLDYLLEKEGGNLKRSGHNEWCLREHDSLKISNGKWHWFSKGVGGANALSFLIKGRGMTFLEAVGELLSASVPSRAPLPRANAPPQKQRKLVLPKPHWNNGKALAYLINKRGINREIAEDCIRLDLVYESMIYDKAKQPPKPCCVFVGKDRQGVAKSAFRRSLEGSIRKDAAGSDKRYGFCLEALAGGENLFVCEAAIDALSVASLHQIMGYDWHKNHYLSLGGTSPLAVITFLENHPLVRRVYLCLDNDPAGWTAGEIIGRKIEERFAGRELSVDVSPPKNGKDYNETLLAFQSQARSGKEPHKNGRTGTSER